MRILSLSTFHEQCGIATYSESLIKALRKLDVDVDVVAPYRRSGDPGRGEQPARLWNRNRAFGFEALRAHREIRCRKPDVVHAQVNLALFSSRFLFAIAALCRRDGIPFVATLHGRRGGSLGRNFKWSRLLFALRHADLVVHNDAHRLELARDRVHVIPHGVDPVAPRDPIAARRRIGLKTNGPVLAHFGFLVPDKGVHDVLAAVASLRTREFPDLFFWVAGAVAGDRDSRQYYERLHHMARALGVQDAVHLTGEFVDGERLGDELQAADWIVLNYATGNSQGASGAVRTALTSGSPVAVSSASVFDDVRDGVFTLRGPLRESLAAVLRDQRLAQQTVERAARFCDDNSWDKVAARHLAVYRQLAQSIGASSH